MHNMRAPVLKKDVIIIGIPVEFIGSIGLFLIERFSFAVPYLFSNIPVLTFITYITTTMIRANRLIYPSGIGGRIGYKIRTGRICCKSNIIGIFNLKLSLPTLFQRY